MDFKSMHYLNENSDTHICQIKPLVKLSLMDVSRICKIVRMESNRTNIVDHKQYTFNSQAK